MPDPLSSKMGFGMKVTVLPYCQATFFTMQLNRVTLSAWRRRLVADVDLGLPGGADLMVVNLNLDPEVNTADISGRGLGK